MSINDDDTESLCIEIINNQCKNININTMYRPLAGKIKPFKAYLKDLFVKAQKSNKPIYLLGDFNLNVLEYDSNTKVKGFLNLLFQNSFIPVINKPTRVTRNTATAIDHIITNSFISSDFHTGIIKSDISDHFPIFIICKTRSISIYNEDITVTKRNINEKSINNSRY